MTKQLKGTGGNYMAKVLALALPGVLEPRKGYSVTVAHDDWCAIYRDLPCNCDPDVTVEGFTEWAAKRGIDLHD